MEQRILEAEEELERIRAEVQNAAAAGDAARLAEASRAMEASERQVERLYERWAELEAKQS
jgi:ATP-binding cassette subfamily F protein uup